MEQSDCPALEAIAQREEQQCGFVTPPAQPQGWIFHSMTQCANVGRDLGPPPENPCHKFLRKTMPLRLRP